MDGPEIDLRALVDVLRRHLGLIVAVAATLIAITAGILLILKPHFTATALIFVDTAQKNLLEPERGTPASSATDNARVDSEVEIVRATPTLLRMIADQNLLSDPEFIGRIDLRQHVLAFLRLLDPHHPHGAMTPADLAERLRPSISVQRRGQTYIVAIAARDISPHMAARLANAMAQAHIALQVEAKSQVVLNALNLLDPHLAMASRALVASENALEIYLNEASAQISSQAENRYLAALRGELSEIVAARKDLIDRLDSAGASLARGAFADLAATLSSGPVRAYQKQRLDILARLAADAPDSAENQLLQDGLTTLETQMRAAADVEIAWLRKELSTYQEKASGINEQIRQAVLDSDLPPEMLTQLYELHKNAALAYSNYERLMARTNDLRAQADLQVPDSRLVAAATPPLTPSFPNIPLSLALAGLSGLGLGVGAALIFEVYLGGFISPEQLETATRRAVSASLPLARSLPRSGQAPPTGLADDAVNAPRSPYAECLRQMRQQIDTMLAAGPGGPHGVDLPTARRGRVALVTSSLPREGKTTTALALARTYALAGQRTLLIDADLRQPALCKHLQHPMPSGLLRYLSGQLSPEYLGTLLVADPLSPLVALGGADQTQDSTEPLLTAPAFGHLIGAARQAFDIVVIDTPPVAASVDGTHLMHFADAVIFLVRYATTGQNEVLRALKTLDRSVRPGVPTLMALTHQPLAAKTYGGHFAAEYSNT